MIKFFNPEWWEIRNLKKNHALGKYVESNPEGYYIRIIESGKHLFYQDHDRAFIAEILIKKDRAMLFENSLKNWDDGTQISQQERELIFSRIGLYFKNIQNIEMIKWNGPASEA